MKPQAQPAEPCVLVIFGAAGDLTKRLLVPALHNLRKARLLPEEFAVIGIARSNKDNETFRRELGASLSEFDGGKAGDEDWDWLAQRMSYLPGEFDDPEVYTKLSQLLMKTDQTHRTGGNYLFYLATPPQVFATVVQRLGDAGLVR
jgi:glucose-6-phosphate 1-dehydrogenase